MLLDIPVPEIKRFERELLEYVSQNYSSLKEEIKDKQELTDAIEEQLKEAISKFKEEFEVEVADEGSLAV
jgi:F-type H+-transporting ATPase subunit alpha